VVGAEALARWFHPVEGELFPQAFLPIAEELGVLGELDAAVLRCSVEAVRTLQEKDVCIPKLAVNVSRSRLLDHDLIWSIERFSNLPCQLAFEMLETIDFEDEMEEILPAINHVRARGVSIEIDDFGSSKASISSLLKLRPSRLKIDRSLVAGLGSREADTESVLRAIGDMSQSLGIAVTAEGVETVTQVAQLQRFGCSNLQGYLFAKPLTVKEFAIWHRERPDMARLSDRIEEMAAAAGLPDRFLAQSA
jgi:EAL domain-containing protein (putative c-di-GMP-specific phosphodiesterase class I)